MNKKNLIFLILGFFLIVFFSNLVLSAVCRPGFLYVGILTNDSIGIGQSISAKIQVTPEVPNYKNIRIVARLLENDIEIAGTRKDTFADSNGIVVIDFNYQHPRTGDIKIEAIAGDPTTSKYRATKIIKIEKRLRIKLTCPPTAYVSRDITCSWKSEDRDTGSPISSQPLITLTQGTKELSYVPSGTNSIAFKTDITGSIMVKVEITKEGYLPDSETLYLAVQKTAVQQTFYLDNLDFFSLREGIKTGTHQFKFKVEESGVIADVQMINGNIRTPAGQEVGLIFNKQGDSWISTYNFVQPGQVYKFFGTIVFSDISKENINFEYQIATVTEMTEDWWAQWLPIIIGGSAGFIVILVVIIILIVRRKR